jgi:hypothetical protein
MQKMTKSLKPIMIATSALACILFAPLTSATDLDKMVMSHLKTSGELSKIARCSGSSESEVEQALTSSLEDCKKQHNTESDAFQVCLKSSASKSLNVDTDKMNACMASNTKSSATKIDNTSMDMQAIYKQHGVSAEDLALLAQMQSLVGKGDQQTASPTNSQSAQNPMALMFGGAQKNSIEQITLPVFPNSKLAMHIPITTTLDIDGKKIKTLPVATLSSDQSFATVLAFYKAKLPDYKVLKNDTGRTILMQHVPKGFDVIKDTDILSTIPHVALAHAVASSIAPDAKVSIEIAYQKEK